MGSGENPRGRVIIDKLIDDLIAVQLPQMEVHIQESLARLIIEATDNEEKTGIPVSDYTAKAEPK